MRVLRILAMAGLLVATSGHHANAADACIVGQRWDAVLGKAWNLVAECAHPERPVRLAGATGLVRAAEVKAIALAGPAVRAGDAVRLWAQEANVRIEMAGVVERSAAIGERVTVRLERRGFGEGFEIRRMEGIVRGAGDVEMER